MKRDLKENEGMSRRGFIAKCGAAVVVTAACELLSVFSDPSVANAKVVSNCTSCTSACVTSCTSSTCVNVGPPEVPPPTCVQGFKSTK